MKLMVYNELYLRFKEQLRAIIAKFCLHVLCILGIDGYGFFKVVEIKEIENQCLGRILICSKIKLYTKETVM